MPFTNDLSYCDNSIAKAVFGKTARSEKPIHFVKQPTRLEFIQDVNPCFRIFNVFHTRYFLRHLAVLLDTNLSRVMVEPDGIEPTTSSLQS